MPLKGMIESSLLSKDEPLIPNILIKLWGFEFLEGGLEIRKIGKNGPLNSDIYCLKKTRGALM